MEKGQTLDTENCICGSSSAYGDILSCRFQEKILKEIKPLISVTYDWLKFLLQSSVKPIVDFLTFCEFHTLSLDLSGMRPSPCRPPPIILYLVFYNDVKEKF